MLVKMRFFSLEILTNWTSLKPSKNKPKLMEIKAAIIARGLNCVKLDKVLISTVK